MNNDYIVGTFVREEKNRFLCIVDINGLVEECYIPSSCRLENFLELAGKEVLLKENQNKNARTRLTVYALQIRKNYMILRTSEANSIVFGAIKSRRFSFLGKRNVVEKECNVEDYKADIYLPETNTVIEIKSIISIEKSAIFPTVYSDRALKQLRIIKGLLEKGYKFVYIFVSLNPYVKTLSLSLDEKQYEYRKLFLECVERGMIYKAYTSRFDGNNASINKEIPISVR